MRGHAEMNETRQALKQSPRSHAEWTLIHTHRSTHSLYSNTQCPLVLMCESLHFSLWYICHWG